MKARWTMNEAERVIAERAAVSVKTESDAVFQVARHMLLGASFAHGKTWLRPVWDRKVAAWTLGEKRTSVVFDDAYDAALTYVRLIGLTATRKLLEQHFYASYHKAKGT